MSLETWTGKNVYLEMWEGGDFHQWVWSREMS